MTSLFKMFVFTALLFAGNAFAQDFAGSLSAAQSAREALVAAPSAETAQAAAEAAEMARAAATTAEQIAQVNALIAEVNAVIANAGLTVTTAGAAAGMTVTWGVVGATALGVAAAYQVYDNQRSP